MSFACCGQRASVTVSAVDSYRLGSVNADDSFSTGDTAPIGLLTVLRPGPNAYHMIANIATTIPVSINLWVHTINESSRREAKSGSDGSKIAAGRMIPIMNGLIWRSLPVSVVTVIPNAPTQANTPSTGFQS